MQRTSAHFHRSQLLAREVPRNLLERHLSYQVKTTARSARPGRVFAPARGTPFGAEGRSRTCGTAGRRDRGRNSYASARSRPQPETEPDYLRLGQLGQRGVGPDPLASLYGRLRGQVGHGLESLDELGPAVRVAAVVKGVDTDEDVAGPKGLGPGQGEGQEYRVRAGTYVTGMPGPISSARSWWGNGQVAGEGGAPNWRRSIFITTWRSTWESTGHAGERRPARPGGAGRNRSSMRAPKPSEYRLPMRWPNRGPRSRARRREAACLPGPSNLSIVL